MQSHALLVLAFVATGSAAALNPLGEVVSLMDSLTAKIIKMGEDEAKAYKDFFEWCDDASKNLGFEIKTATAKKEKLEATISKSADDAEASSGKIEELAGFLASDAADLKSATEIREKEAADFAAEESELVQAVSALSRAIQIIEKDMAKNPAAFAQVDTSRVSAVIKALTVVVDAASMNGADKQRLLGLVQQQQNSDDDDDAPGAPAAAMYKTHSTSIFDVLEDLKEKSEEQLASLRKAETNAKHNYEMLKQSLEDQSAANNKAMKQEKAAKAASEQTKAIAEGELTLTVKSLADSNAALETAHSNCMTTAADHEATVRARDEELKVIAQAKSLLVSSSSGAVSQTYSLIQVAGQTQVSSTLRTRADLANAEVVNMVKRLAREQHSTALAQLASRIQAVLRYGGGSGSDPFAKVKELIQNMIMQLEATAQSEATEKAYCDEQMAKTEEKKSELDDDIAKLTAKIDMAAARSTQLKAEVKELQDELAALAKLQAEMDSIRAESHAAYVEAKSDLEQGLEGVRKALGVLRDYYSAGASASMLQTEGDDALGQPTVPELHEKSTGAGSSIIGILEVVESDFAKNLAVEEGEEADAAAEYEKTTQENAVTKTLKDQDVKYKTLEFKSLDKSIADLSSDRDAANAEYSAVMEYYGKIKMRCIAKPETYETRQKRRQAEIAGLKQALSILEDETALVQRRKRGGRHGAFLGF
jgi:cell division protein FtsB